MCILWTCRLAPTPCCCWTEPSTRRISGSQMHSLVGDKSDPCTDTAADVAGEAAVRRQLTANLALNTLVLK